MRVIAGTARGTKLGPVPDGTRPMTDRAREGLFSSLAERVPGARVLDLYSGTGAVGIEALSRGAEHVVFVDDAAAAQSAIKANLVKTHLSGKATSVRTTVQRYLGGHPNPVELVFVDAPYQLPEEELDNVMSRLAGGWLASGWTVMLSRSRRGYMPVIPIDWRVSKSLKYGDTRLYLYREA